MNSPHFSVVAPHIDELSEVLEGGALRRGEAAAEPALERARLAPAEVHEGDQHEEDEHPGRTSGAGNRPREVLAKVARGDAG